MGPDNLYTLSKNLYDFCITVKNAPLRETAIISGLTDPEMNRTYVQYNPDKGTTTLIFVCNGKHFFEKVKTMSNTTFNLEKGVLFAALKASGCPGKKVAELYNQVVFTKRVRRKEKQFLFSDSFYRYLVTHNFSFTEKELDEIMSTLWNPEKDLETSLLYFLAKYECNIPEESIKYLVNNAVLKQHKNK